MCKADAALYSSRADLGVGFERAFSAPRYRSAARFRANPGPAGMRGFLPPALDCIDRKVRCGAQRLRRRNWFWRVARRPHAPPERREHPQAAAFLLIATLLALIRTTDGGARALEAACEPVRCALSGDLDRHGPDRFPVSWGCREGLFRLAGRRHAGRDTARARDPVLSALRGRDPDFCQRAMSIARGALFGFFCYATFELTSLSLLKHWTWPVVIVDVAWGSVVTALSSTLGLMIANWITPKI